MKFVFMRTERPTRPSWNNISKYWIMPSFCQVPDNQELIWSSIWNWMRGSGDRFVRKPVRNKENMAKRISELRAEDPAVRLNAINRIGFIGGTASKAIPDLVRLMKDPYEPVRQSLAYALGSMGAKAVKPVVKHLGDEKKAFDDDLTGELKEAIEDFKATRWSKSDGESEAEETDETEESDSDTGDTDEKAEEEETASG